jgi:hypothetical protein
MAIWTEGFKISLEAVLTVSALLQRRSVILRESGVSSTPQLFDFNISISECRIARFRGDDSRRCGASAFIKYASAFSPRDAPELCMNLSPKEGVALP